MMHRQVTAQIQIIIVEVVASAIILSFHKKVGEIIGRESFHTAKKTIMKEAFIISGDYGTR